MKTVVFLGPTMGASQARSLLNAHVVGPVAFGDVYRALKSGYERVVIIDGYFDQKVPVWHREILFALSEGIQVYGAASMGALRAAELAPFGMRGHGTIFRSFAEGAIEADDEVVVSHEGADRGYHATSVALINMRGTLGAASAEGIISEALAHRLSEMAQNTYFPERTYHRLLSEARRAQLGGIVALREWLGNDFEGALDFKASDAASLLERLQVPEPSTPANFTFNPTSNWNVFIREVERTHSALDESL